MRVLNIPQALIGVPMSEEEVDQAIRQLDVDRSGHIDKNEFVTWWTQKAAAMREDQPLARKLRKIADKGRRMFDTDIHTAGESKLAHMDIENALGCWRNL